MHTCSLLKYDQEFEAERNFSMNPGQFSHFQMILLKAREGSGLSNVTQLKSETVYGIGIKSLDSSQKDNRSTMPPHLFACDFEQST